MTETKWNACTDPQPMLEFLRGKASERKLRLFACAGLRTRQTLLSISENRDIVEVAERYADGQASDLERRSTSVASYLLHGKVRGMGPQAYPFLFSAATALGNDRLLGDLISAAEREADEARMESAQFLRDIFGPIPFRTITIDPHHLATPVTSLALAIYTDRAFDRLPILADTLEDAGCHDAAILTHCRGDGEHVRGCWVVDSLLGKA